MHRVELVAYQEMDNNNAGRYSCPQRVSLRHLGGEHYAHSSRTEHSLALHVGEN